MIKTLILISLFTSIYAQTGVLKRVVDGDTVIFKSYGDKVICRLQYIDTPESKNNNKLKRDLKGSVVSVKNMLSAGKSASKRLKQFLHVNSKYNYDVSGSDRYGRSICSIQLPTGERVNDVMIADGYAVPFTRYISKRNRRYFDDLMFSAKRAKSGLWGTHFKAMEALRYSHKESVW